MSDLSNTKEIYPGVFLLKQQTVRNNDELSYVFKIQVDRLNQVEFTADFRGSENVFIEGRNSLISETLVEPFKTEIVAKLLLKKDWKLKSKFK